MALAFKLYYDQGDYADFYVGEVRVTLAAVESPNRFTLRVNADGKPGMEDRTFTITNERAVEILPEVFVSAGDRVPDDGEQAKVVINAPRHIRIDRASVYFERKRQRAS